MPVACRHMAKDFFRDYALCIIFPLIGHFVTRSFAILIFPDFPMMAFSSVIEPLRAALSRSVLVVSIGPVTSEALDRHGVHVDLSPDQPKLGALVDCLGIAGARLQREKRRERL